MQKKMKAAVFKDVENIVIEERDLPACPPGGLLVKVAFCGICGGDVRNYYNGLKDGVKNQIMGHEITGEVVEAAPGVIRFKRGDRVAMAPDVSCGECWYCRRGYVNLCDNHRMLGTHFPGGYAQYIALSPEILQRGFVEPIPEGMSYEHAAFAETASAVLACQKLNNIQLGDCVAIIGDGPVGCLHIEVSYARGASKVMMIGQDRIELARQFSPDLLLSNKNPKDALQQVLLATDGVGADIVICAVPTTAVQPQALSMVRKRGTVVIYGGVPQNAAETKLDSNRIHYGEITLIGAFSYPATGLADALSAIHTGKINADKYLGPKVPLEDVERGMELVKSGKALKVLIDPWA